MKPLIFIFLFFTSFAGFTQTNQAVTELYLSNNFTPKSGITPGSNNTQAMDCDQITARYNVTISGTTSTGKRLPSQNQLTASSSCPAIGDSYQGGLVAYKYVSGDPGYVSGECHGLIVSTVNVGNTNSWGCNGTDLSGASGTALGTGQQNTIDILAGCSTAGIPAKLCSDYSSSGYSDWFLPSKDELAKLQASKSILGIPDNTYWTSSEADATHAWAQNFAGGGPQTAVDKIAAVSIYVRAIRYF